jgi:lipid A 3-O-deacylase
MEELKSRSNLKRSVPAGLAWLFLVCLGWPSSGSAFAQEQTGFMAITEENDSFSSPFGAHPDRHYTQGLKVVLLGGDDFGTNVMAALDRVLPAWGFRAEAGDLGWVVVGQNIYTPQNLLTNALIETDRPYAGWLYTGAIYQRRGAPEPNLAVMENFEINLGVVGPESMAEEAQKTIHRWWFPNDIPQGWGNQLKTEPGLALKYARLWRYSPSANTARYVDVIPRVGGVLGNVFTFATGGATVRLGYDLPPDFGPQIIDSPASVNGGLTRQAPAFFAYAFGSLDGRIVGHNITLDGNSFRGGPSVDKNTFVADLSWGFALQLFRLIELSYTRIIRTEEFQGQKGNDVFGSILLKGKFGF